MKDIILPLYGEPIGERPISHLARIHLGGSRDWSKVKFRESHGEEKLPRWSCGECPRADYGALKTQGCKLGPPWRVGP